MRAIVGDHHGDGRIMSRKRMSFPNAPQLTRRGFCLCCAAAAGTIADGGWLTPPQAFAQARSLVDIIRDAAASAPIKTHKARDRISVLEGSGGNIAVLTGDDGKLLIDAGITVSRLRLQQAIQALGNEPVTHLINTHWHFDHTDGNAWLNAEGAIIMAHENTRKHLLSAQRVEDWDFNFPSSPLPAVPTELVGAEKMLKLNGATIALRYHANAHTDSDLSVTFTEADVVHCGDAFWNGIYPFIDYSTGGSIDGAIKATEAILAVVTDRTIVIPGHGTPLSNKAELASYREMLVAIRDNVAKLKQQGRSVDETIAAKPTTAFDAKWGQFVISPALFTRLVYQGV
jgi:glyoxylase-like metal-dependent hydrolase (beta-lactamase superfamily II)